jgi:hypothetical protein
MGMIMSTPTMVQVCASPALVNHQEEVFWLIGLDAPIMENAFQIHFKMSKKLDKKFLVYI